MVLKTNYIILYDGYCKLCNFSLQFVLKRDKKKVFQYLALQSNEAKELLSMRSVENDLPDSVLLWEEGTLYSKSEAFFRILPHFGKAYKLFFVFKIIPRKLSDKIYDLIARNRYKWFGRKEQCGIIISQDE
jgi:predicted DCC family thiol-disulfide oxidoreductase YuxK